MLFFQTSIYLFMYFDVCKGLRCTNTVEVCGDSPAIRVEENLKSPSPSGTKEHLSRTTEVPKVSWIAVLHKKIHNPCQ
jgi:hypothetical protein